MGAPLFTKAYRHYLKFKLTDETTAAYRKLTHAVTLTPSRSNNDVTLEYLSTETAENYTRSFSQAYAISYGIRADDEVTKFLLENVNNLNVEVELVNVLELSDSEKIVDYGKYNLNQVPIENQVSGQLVNTGTLQLIAGSLETGGTFDETSLAYTAPAAQTPPAEG